MNVYLTIFGKPRYLGLAKIDNVKILHDLEENKSRWIVIKTPRGYEMGLPGGRLSPEQEEKYQAESATFEDTTESLLQNVEFVREANSQDIENYYTCRSDEQEALLKARDISLTHDLKMKLVDVEYMLDRKKLYFYFTAEQRIDFRAYVRDLAHEFKTRIEMRQIGIRDEARIVRGIASCGRPCCCGYWLRGFSPISIKIVKEQRTALNPTKISGLCGRLMCCMSYEKELYNELWSKLPGPGAKIKTEQGVYILESLDLGREQVNVRFPTGRLVPVLISEFPDFKEAVLKGEEWGEDKEFLEKKKAAQERIARIEQAKLERQERQERQERPRVRVNAGTLRPSKPVTSQSQNQNQDSRKNKPVKTKQANKNKSQRRRKPHKDNKDSSKENN